MLNPLVAASKECKERAGARLHGAAGEQEDRTCSGAQASSRDWRASEGSAGRGDGWGATKARRPRTTTARGTYHCECRAALLWRGAPKAVGTSPESLLELGRGSLAGKAAIGSATQGTRWVVQVRESCLREGKSERDWGKSETGGGGESIAAALVPVAQWQTRRPAWCRRRGAGAPWSTLNRRSRLGGMGAGNQVLVVHLIDIYLTCVGSALSCAHFDSHMGV